MNQAQDTKPQADIVPDAYVRMRYAQLCTCCGTTSEYTRLFTRTRLRSTLGTGWVLNTHICDEPKWNLPVITENAEPQILTICVHCTDSAIAAHMAALPPLPPPLHENTAAQIAADLEHVPHPRVTRWCDARGFWHIEATKRETPKPTPAPQIKTVDDLLAALK